MNDLTPLKKENAVATTSVFDDFEDFQKALQMAAALSKTTLIPQNFQGKPEDCLVAIDFSRRLGLPPTAVLPHLYVIGGRPSTSAQFMISLVNRSGQFSRIQWDEKVNGNVDVLVNGARRTIPNYSAVAWFEEVATGKRFESPTVDVRFAQNAGWLIKKDRYGKDMDSQWLKMPQVMCRYRSAAILIKTVCPELAMGMEFTEDLKDADDFHDDHYVPQNPNMETSTVKPETIEAVVIEPAKAADVQEEEFYALKDAIENADSETLRTIGRQIADSGLGDQYLDELRAAFKARRSALAFENRAAMMEQEPPKKDDEPPKGKSAGKKSEKELALEQRMTTALNFTELSAVLSDVESAILAKDIPSASYTEFERLYKERAAIIKANSKEVENDLFETLEADVKRAEGDKDQKQWALELGKAIFNQTDPAFIRANNLQTADEWKESGALTPELHAAVVKYARARIAAFF